MIKRDEDNGMLGGVCAGISKHFQEKGQDVNANLVRLLFALTSLATGVFPMVIIYVILWAIIPSGEE